MFDHINFKEQKMRKAKIIRLYPGGIITVAVSLLIGGLVAGFPVLFSSCDNSKDNRHTITVTQVSGGSFSVQVGNGTASDSNTSAQEGETITLSATPGNGRLFGGFILTGANLNTGSGTVRKFTMPASPVTVTANFVDEERSNFHVYLGFGQSNMEGANSLPNNGLTNTYTSYRNPRFQVLAAVKLPGERAADQWHDAYPPLVRQDRGLCPADGFGRYLVKNIPDSSGIKIGVVIVAVAGAKLDGFDKENCVAYYQNQEDWMKQLVNEYGGNPYQRLVELGRLAQERGVIKGILLHQGEGGGGTPSWEVNVKRIYDNLLEDLNLEPNSIPLLAGEIHKNAGSSAFINKLPQQSAQFYVISSDKLTTAVDAGSPDTGGADRVHFSPEGMMTLGERYGEKMFELLYK
jgi:hypothetical protein